MRRLGLLLWPVGVALGLAAESVKFGWGDPRHWIPDLAVGWTFIACGLIASTRRPQSRAGPLMVATGFTWFFGNFDQTHVVALVWAAARTPNLYHGPLVHLMLAYPSGRPSSRLTRSAIGVGYVAAIVTPIWFNDGATIILAALMLAVSARDYARSVGRARRARLVALRVVALLSFVLAGGAIARLAVPAENAVGPSHLMYDAALCIVAVSLFAGLMSAPWERAAVTDLVVELGEARSGTLRDELSRALGDPTLSVAYWLPDAGAFVDSEGRAFSLPTDDSERSVTMVERDGQPVAALVHAQAVLDDPGLLEAVSSAAQLAASNARLQAEVRAKVLELQASRRRILEAGDEARRRLERRLHEGAEQRLDHLAQSLRTASIEAPGAGMSERIERAGAQVGLTLEELGRLGRGLHPRELSERGLEGALAALAERSSVPVTVAVTSDGIPYEVEAAAYFVCSEALANVAKYASASRVAVSVRSSGGRVRIEIQDDGVGGADPTRGSGIRGLTDRVETLGGTLRVDSAPGKGTRLVAEIPLSGEAP